MKNKIDDDIHDLVHLLAAAKLWMEKVDKKVQEIMRHRKKKNDKNISMGNTP